MNPSGTTTSGPPAQQGRVRWRRFAAIALPSLAAVAAVMVLTAEGAIGASFSISGQQFKVSADSLNGTGFQQFATIDHTAKGTLVPVAESEIGSAQITGLCQSIVAPFPFGLGDFTLRITAGAGGTPVSADSLIIDANQLSGSTATFKQINIGQDASTLNAVSGVPVGTVGTFGQQASSVSITDLRQVAYSTSAGTFTLPGFGLRLAPGDNPCF
jgi:Family of unknown function (DUF6230)